jgi:DNA mismatch repair protein MutL
MSVIRILSEKVASQIAAGEVIERPASVVKELIDNSIDAGADRISVRTENGGRTLIRVTDNGVGMSRDDLLLSIERHATSKIESVSDLLAVKTLGFRGEALPSIATVSKLEIVSRLGEELAGHRLRISGGRLIGIEETGAPRGTTAEVRDIFFNVPARRKFLRTAKTETDHVIDVLTRLSMPLPGIHFRLDDRTETIMNLPASNDQLLRISSLFGRSVAESMKVVHRKGNTIVVTAYLASFEHSRSKADRLFLYVNGRNVRDRLVARAIMEGYGQRLMKGRYPQAIVFLDIDPFVVDANVHPTKQEVRFGQPQQIFQTILSVVEEGLKERFQQFFDVKNGNLNEQGHSQGQTTLISEPIWKYLESGSPDKFPDRPVEQGELMDGGDIELIGQLANTYILCQTKDGLLMIDQHAAHERVLFEKLRKDADRSKIEVQGLLVPLTIELSLKDSRTLLEKGDQLKRIGIELEPFGGHTFLLRAVPSLMENANWISLLQELIPALEEDGLHNERVMERILTVMACHGSLRAGRRMTQEEMIHLIKQLQEVALPTNCPHGRPILRTFLFYEIEKMFKRIV